MSLDAEGSVLYRRKARGRFGGTQSTFDAMDFLARLLMHIPQPKLHTVRYYGERFLMVKEPAPQVIIVENWHEELKRLVTTE